MQTIDINTTQNVEIQYDLATIWERIGAFVIDFIIMYASAIILSIIFTSLFTMEDGEIVSALIVSPVIIFYTLVSEAFTHGQSIGKKALDIRVVKLDGKNPVIRDYILRWIFRPVDIYLSVGTISTILITSSDRSQRIGDILAHTTVVKMRPNRAVQLTDILRIKSLDNYTPQYEGIQNISEEDMLIVMEILKSHNLYPNRAHTEALVELSGKIQEKLKLEQAPSNKKEFLSNVLKDYIVLTR